MPDHRLIMYHKHPSSGRTLFLRLNGTVCHFANLSPQATIADYQTGAEQVFEYPPTLLTDAEARLGLTSGTLVIDRELTAKVTEADRLLDIYLARFKVTDPPFEQIAALDGKFIAITEARSLPPAELELLRLAYSVIMDD